MNSIFSQSITECNTTYYKYFGILRYMINIINNR